MKPWPHVPLAELCTPKTGSVDPTMLGGRKFLYIDIGSIDVATKYVTAARWLAGHEAPSRARKSVAEGDVIVSMTRPNLNAVAFIGPELSGQVCSTGFAVLRAGPKLDPSFLFHFVQTPQFVDRLSALTTGALYPAVTESQVRQQTIPLPPLAEQRRIVDILDRAASIRRLRQQAQDTARLIIPALFSKMFGDPATNPMGWPVATLGELGTLERGRSRHRPRNDPALLGGPYPLVQTGEVTAAEWFITDHKATYSEMGLAQSRLWPKGTLCITIAANIANSGLLSFDACFPDSVVAFQPRSRVTPFYAKACLDFLREGIDRVAPKLAQKNINLEILSQVPFPVPPLDLQETFGVQVIAILRMQSRMSAAGVVAEDTAKALTLRFLA